MKLGKCDKCECDCDSASEPETPLVAAIPRSESQANMDAIPYGPNPKPKEGNDDKLKMKPAAKKMENKKMEKPPKSIVKELKEDDLPPGLFQDQTSFKEAVEKRGTWKARLRRTKSRMDFGFSYKN